MIQWVSAGYEHKNHAVVPDGLYTEKTSGLRRALTLCGRTIEVKQAGATGAISGIDCNSCQMSLRSGPPHDQNYPR